MQRFARISDGIVMEIVEVPDDLDVNHFAHPDIVATFVANPPIEVRSGWLYDGSSYAAPPGPEAPPPAPTLLPASVFFDRLTEEEAEQLDEAMMAKPVKFKRAWQAATEFSETADLWPVMREEMVGLFGEERTAELLSTT